MCPLKACRRAREEAVRRYAVKAMVMFYIDGSVVLLTERRSRFSSLGRTPSVSSWVVASWSTSLAGTAVEVLGIGAGLMKDVSSSSGLSGLSSGDAISAYSLTE